MNEENSRKVCGKLEELKTSGTIADFLFMPLPYGEFIELKFNNGETLRLSAEVGDMEMAGFGYFLLQEIS